MPVYEALCKSCGKVHNYYRRVADCMDTPECCGEKTQKVILSAPAGFADLPGYESPITGEWIEGRAARRNDLAKHGCRPWEGMEQEQKYAAECKRQIEAKDDKELDDAARVAWNQLKPEQQRALESA